VVNLDSITFDKSVTWDLWNPTTGGEGNKYGGSIYFSTLFHDGSEIAMLSFNVDPGTYRVCGTWTGHNLAHGSNVPVTVLNGIQQIGSAPAQVKKTVARLQMVPILQEFCDWNAGEFRTCTDLDRMMIYKFHSDGHGEVFAQSKRADRVSYWFGRVALNTAGGSNS